LHQSDLLHSILGKYWGYKTFRPLQEDIINSSLNDKDTLALLPTGGGKSLCYQIPALVKEGLCLVVSPLIALMKDQLEGLRSKNIKAEAVYSGMRKREIDRILDNCIYGEVKFLFLSPERLESDLFKARVTKMNINLIAIDEAHCISQWGHDFRPSYFNIAALRELKPKAPILALTATATKFVQKDIVENLELKDVEIFKKSFLRPNISFASIESEDKLGLLVSYLKKEKGSSIIYARRRKSTKIIAEILHKNKISTSFYHAGLSMERRNTIQQDWILGKVKNIVATNAFGMGIDKSDVRLVMHVDIPSSIEEYYQEAGRAGRDEKEAKAILVFDQGNVQRSKSDLIKSFPEISDIKKIYKALSIYFDLAIGSGMGESFDFDMKSFSGRFDLNISMVFYSLKELERAGYIIMSDAISQTSQVQIRIDKLNLESFLDENRPYEKLIQILLRNYEGIFSDYVKISEDHIAKVLSQSAKEVRKKLLSLNKLDIIAYKPQNQKGTVHYLCERLTSDNLKIDIKAYNKRKSRAADRLKSMLLYLNSGECKQQFICKYFGEIKTQNCEVCDYCLSNKANKKHKDLRKEIEALLKRNSLDRDYGFKEFINLWPLESRDNVLKHLSFLESEDYIRIIEDKIHWQAKKEN
jgi:ATP-dependent DNA helicase RecQ